MIMHWKYERHSRMLFAHLAAVCCTMLQYVAVCCSVLQCVAECCSLLNALTHPLHLLLILYDIYRATLYTHVLYIG